MGQMLERRILPTDASERDAQSVIDQHDQEYRDADLDSVTLVQIASLLPADSPRLSGEDPAHTHSLAEIESSLPPIIVNRRTMRVVDGMHRLRVALIRGAEKIEVQFFDGTDELAFLLAVKANITHGLPLSRADRMAAATRIIESQPQWSNRAIATVTGLSPGTINAARQRITSQSHQLNTRLGQDGRARPLNGASGRLRATEILETRPDLPLRELAKAAGVSVGTARDVRERIRLGVDPLPPRQRAAAARDVAGAGYGDGVTGPTGPADHTETAVYPDGPARGRRRSARPPAPGKIPPSGGRMSRGNEVLHWPSIRNKMTKDPALKYAESGRALVKWIDAHMVDAEDWKSVLDAVPPHWSNDIADLAASCAERWLDIAHALGWRPPDDSPAQ